MKHLLVVTAMLSASNVAAGGFEASRLDTKFIYEEGNFGEVSHVMLDYDVTADVKRSGASANIIERSVKSNQSRTTTSVKTNIGGLDVGLSQYRSGSIQLSGNSANYSVNGTSLGGSVPESDVKMDTITLMGKASLTDEVDILFGINRNILKNSSVTTALGTYTIKGASKTSPLVGFAYSKPKIALRIELLMQPSSTLTANTGYVKSALGNVAGYADAPSFDADVIRPNTVTLNFQTGVAKDTLAYGFIHRTNWGSAQIDAQTGTAGSSITSQFWDTTTYSFGVARKMSENLALTGSFTKETGGTGSTSSSFTVNNGYNAISLGARYKKDKITISGSYNYLSLGDFDVISGGVNMASYRNNSVSALALKVGIEF